MCLFSFFAWRSCGSSCVQFVAASVLRQAPSKSQASCWSLSMIRWESDRRLGFLFTHMKAVRLEDSPSFCKTWWDSAHQAGCFHPPGLSSVGPGLQIRSQTCQPICFWCGLESCSRGLSGKPVGSAVATLGQGAVWHWWGCSSARRKTLMEDEVFAVETIQEVGFFPSPFCTF